MKHNQNIKNEKLHYNSINNDTSSNAEFTKFQH